MFMNDVHKKEEIRIIATQHLRKFGIKFRPKKCKQQIQTNNKNGRKFFKMPLETLATQTVTLSDGRQLVLPKLVHEMCSYILTKVQTEGIFRKEGSKSRQNEIKLSLDRGCVLGHEHHEIDVAVVLKSFLRELPEPLIPTLYHELFLRCSIVVNKVEAILLACLLLPTEHLNVLSYLMQFFSQVASYHEANKMNFTNLSIVIGPNVFPIDEKVAPKSQHILTKNCDIIKILMENCHSIGVIPEHIIEQIGNTSGNESELSNKQKKKRRSGSLTRMFNGLKKIVGSKIGEEASTNIVTPDLLITPSINRSTKKRKSDHSGLSLKKKKDLLHKLPEATLLSTPFTPQRTPISANPNPKTESKVRQDPTAAEVEPQELPKEKKSQWYMRSRSVKSLKSEQELNRRHSIGPKSLLERRWSAVSQASGFRKKKRNSCVIKEDATKPQVEQVEPDYVKVSKAEYEEIKNRVSAIERRISIELENVQCQGDENKEVQEGKTLKNVQTAYEQTLVQSEQLSPTTDQLARRLSRELRIRTKDQQKVIRSPSARKIGSMRRRSREIEKHNAKVIRNQSWHYAPTEMIPRATLRKDKPVPSENLPIEKRVTRSSSLRMQNSNSEHWVSAEGYFANTHTPDKDKVNDRASIAKLRSQNAGMVLAKARLFDNLKDSDSSSSQTSIPRARIATSTIKIGSVRNTEARMSYRVKALRNEERRVKRSMSPRRRNGNLSQRQRLHIAKQYVDLKPKGNNETEKTPLREVNRMEVDTPKSVPHIKRSVMVKSPKRLCRTPQQIDRRTPLKVLATPVCKV